MRKPDLTFPELMFAIGTRAILGAGIGLLLSLRLDTTQRKVLGLAFAVIGAVTTIPAAMAVTRSLRDGRDARHAE